MLCRTLTRRSLATYTPFIARTVYTCPAHWSWFGGLAGATATAHTGAVSVETTNSSRWGSLRPRTARSVSALCRRDASAFRVEERTRIQRGSGNCSAETAIDAREPLMVWAEARGVPRGLLSGAPVRSGGSGLNGRDPFRGGEDGRSRRESTPSQGRRRDGFR